MTGVDRVEMAYLNWCLSDRSEPVYGLARIAGGYVVLDRAGMSTFRAKLRGEVPWGKPDFRARLGVKTSKERGAAESDLRRLAIARSSKASLPDIPLTQGVYLNTGHSNLSATSLSGIKRTGLKIATLVHDMIPLDWPQFQRDGTVRRFEEKMRAAAAYSDLIIANSDGTRGRIEHYFGHWGADPFQVTSHLGVDIFNEARPLSGNNRPYFVTTGTIEPRKNHSLLLDVWDSFEAEIRPDQIPVLHIVGQRGWKNEDVFQRLDSLQGKSWLYEHNDMDDAALKHLLAGSHGLLLPSFAEGYGLPSMEAAQMGIPVICGELAIHHEVLGDYPVYADLQDIYLWKKRILEQAKQRQKDLVYANLAKKPKIPTWSEHFDAVNAAVAKLF
ncbi:glycosyltransferase family 4 protein [Litoreibacter meonggei]|uniref:glycosyltransferase family 4 protein n=1 Tax=Litoreibacter meonggei TaxID=1049199 RepID=UPI001475CBD1|nr:glycosyltransferase family 1 protein [Litoreibacter meonggei]